MSSEQTKQNSPYGNTMNSVSGTAANDVTALTNLLRQRQQLEQQHQLRANHQFLPSNATNSNMSQMLRFPSTSEQQWQHQLQGQGGGTSASMIDASSSSFALSRNGAISSIPPSLFSVRDTSRSVPDNGNAVALAAMGANAFFQSQAMSDGSPSPNISNEGRYPVSSTSSAATTTALNLSAEVTFLRQQQQQLQQQQAAIAARVAAAEQAVDGGSLFLQERIGTSAFGGASSRANFPSLSSPTLQSFSNPSDLATALMLSRNSSGGGGGGGGGGVPAAGNRSSMSFGLGGGSSGATASNTNTPDLTRMLMMLRGDFGTTPTATSTSGSTQASNSLTGSSAMAGVAWPRLDMNDLKIKSKDIGVGSEHSSSSRGLLNKESKKVPPKKRSPKPTPRILKSSNTTKAPISMPYVLYNEEDDDFLTPYQCLLRKQLELFVADPEDVRCSSQQGRTTNIQVGQVGLRCRHCEGGLASRTKGAVYYSHSVEGIYQIGQNIGKVHLAERCYRVPEDIRRKLIVLRNDSRRASSGKAYWSDRIRSLGVYQEGNILKYRTGSSKGDKVSDETCVVIEDAPKDETKMDVEKKRMSQNVENKDEKLSGDSGSSTGIERVSNTEETAASVPEEPKGEY